MGSSYPSQGGTTVSSAGTFGGTSNATPVVAGMYARSLFLHAATRTSQGLNPGNTVDTPAKTEETELAGEGHGTFFGKQKGDETFLPEFARITQPMEGTAPALERTAAEREWMAVDSYCRQSIWGSWSQGYWQTGQPLPADSSSWPLRTALVRSCGELFPPL